MILNFTLDNDSHPCALRYVSRIVIPAAFQIITKTTTFLLFSTIDYSCTITCV